MAVEVLLKMPDGEEIPVSTDNPVLTKILHERLKARELELDPSIIPEIIEQIRDGFYQLQQVLCVLLEFLPGAQYSITIKASDLCKLQYVIRKI
jgi:hypothetical protein